MNGPGVMLKTFTGAFVLMLSVSGAAAQASQGGAEAGGQRGGARPGGRGALPPVPANMNQQQLQAYLDTFALIEAERVLNLTSEQYPSFVARLRHLQQVRRRQTMERRRLVEELRAAVNAAAPRDEDILARVRALEDLEVREAIVLRKAYQDLDGDLTPIQRGRFRLFEEQLERRKLELLTKLGGRGPG